VTKTSRIKMKKPRYVGLPDITEEELRAVIGPLPPAVIWREVDRAREFYEKVCKLDERCFAAAGKRAQIFAGVWDPDLLSSDEVKPHRFERTDEMREAVARIFAEKGMLDELARRRPFWYADLARRFCFQVKQNRAAKKEVLV